MRRASGSPPENPPHFVISGCSTASASPASALSNIGAVTMFSPPARGIGAAVADESKPATGSVIVHYNAAHFAPEAMETLVEQHVDAELARPRSKFPPSTRMRINRAAKAGMLGSLAVSLALAATGNKRWHAASGLVFVACLGVHLTVHRRHLLR